MMRHILRYALIVALLAVTAVAQPITQEVALVWSPPSNGWDVVAYSVHARPVKPGPAAPWDVDQDRIAYLYYGVTNWADASITARVVAVEDAVAWTFGGVEFNVVAVDGSNQFGEWGEPTRYIDFDPPGPVRNLAFLVETNASGGQP